MKEILKNLDRSIELPQDTYLEQDPEILEIFVEELEEIFETLNVLLEEWANGDLDDEQIITLRRSFHTLKGSGRMVGAKSTSELAWNVEDNLNRVIAKNRELTPDLKAFVISVINLYQYKFYQQFKDRQPHDIDLRPLIVLGQGFQQNVDVHPELKTLLNLSETLNSSDDLTGLEFGDEAVETASQENNTVEAPVDHVPEISATVANDFSLDDVELNQTSDQNDLISTDLELDAADQYNSEEFETEEPVREYVTPINEKLIIDSSVQTEATDNDNIAKETLAIFFEEAEEHVDTIRKFIKDEQYTPDQFNRLIRALHTLRGSSSMAHVNDIFEATSKVDHLFKIFVQEDREIDYKEYSLLSEYIEFVEDYLYELKKPQYKKFDLMLIVQKFQEVWKGYDFEVSNVQQSNQSISAVTQLVNLQIDQLLDAEFEFDKRAQTEFPDYFHQLIDQAQILIDNTNNPTAIGIYEFTTLLKESYQSVLKNKTLLEDDYIFELFSHVHQNFIHLFDTLASGQRVTLTGEAHKAIEALRDNTTQLDVNNAETSDQNSAEAIHLASSTDQILNAVNDQQQPLFDDINVDLIAQQAESDAVDENGLDDQIAENNEAQFEFELEKPNDSQDQLNLVNDALDPVEVADSGIEISEQEIKAEQDNLVDTARDQIYEVDAEHLEIDSEDAIEIKENAFAYDSGIEAQNSTAQDDEVAAFLNAELNEDQASIDSTEKIENLLDSASAQNQSEQPPEFVENVDDGEEKLAFEFELENDDLQSTDVSEAVEIEALENVSTENEAHNIDLSDTVESVVEIQQYDSVLIEENQAKELAQEPAELVESVTEKQTTEPVENESIESESTVTESNENESIEANSIAAQSFETDITIDEIETSLVESSVLETNDIAEVPESALAMPIDDVIDLPQHVGSQVGDLNYVIQNISADRDQKDSVDHIADFDLEVLDIFIEEAEELLGYIDVDLSTWSDNLSDTKALNNLMRHLHTLKGGANMAQAENVGLISHELETIYEMVIKGLMQPSDQLVKIIRLIQDDLVDRIQILQEEQIDYSATHVIEVLKNLVNPQKNSAIKAPETLASLWSKRKSAEDEDDFADDEALFEDKSTLEADKATAVVDDVETNETELVEAELVEVVVEQNVAEDAVLLDEKQSTVSDVIVEEQLENTTENTKSDDQALVELDEQQVDVVDAETVEEALTEASTDQEQSAESTLDAVQSEAIDEVHTFMATGQDSIVDDNLQPEDILGIQSQPDPVSKADTSENAIFDVFTAEAAELINDGLSLLQQWTEQRHNRSLLLQLQRIAHSIKGGSKMVGLDLISEISYELEMVFEQFGLHHFNSNAYDTLLESAFVWLRGAVLEKNYDYDQSLKTQLANIQYVDVTAQLPTKFTRSDLLLQEVTTAFEEGDGTEPPSMLGEWDESEKIEQNDEMIRISAETIEKMIDLAGENAINRSRIEMDLSQFGHTLSEMELAIQRLADQLRRMEGELESQIISIHGETGARYEDFDPLEMDQYSSLNQLSKSLAESASDLVDFKTTLSEKIKDTEGILLQQSRIQAEIQEGLMRARLVPFSRLLPRLQRLVRQVSTTLNKPAELVVTNTEGELDRTILEKLVSPLEHMLRNALDHGLEDTQTRLKLGKPEAGRIELDISRQGTDVVISFTDDGQGIQANKIREKALAQNLIQLDQQLSDEQVLQFIFHPGFSTAEKITQISGRGVGLDVVQSGIKALGGEVSVESEVGKGSTFKIRVPTTVAVSDALMVKVQDQQFAVPLSQIDRIVRIAPSELETFFSSADDAFHIDDQTYKLRYLSEFIGGHAVPKLSGVVSSLPVLLIKGNRDQTSAVLVDQLVGSRSQIVMKPIGDQFNNIGAISGATILGDGQVCLILDGQNIARQVQLTNRHDTSLSSTEVGRHRDERRLIMIVDDSVTVRKVTSRLLERQGFDVVTAKDGVDAIEQLHTVRPDLMLLDIEMPRMDGFEVTSLIRHDEVHQALPIIMITSRTGEKHRERAMSLGVTSYMGKPFQEDELLATIQKLLETK
ncbi:response regulator [Acinetobacter sp. 194]|uniref:Hpt domain-containing protein n=1 Tax=Acinetobacter shaoyimingii TaxID=2715164 RepID=UPI00140ADA54|nr:Hpt domain-containing protein [Acinetobacter shaoyimingii]NHB57623.1 response regulator [Acinetobacter shaoyimingii]